MKSIGKLLWQNFSPVRWKISRLHAKSYEYVEKGFDWDSWKKFYNFWCKHSDFANAKPPIVPSKMKYFRKHFIPVSEGINLESVLELTKDVAKRIGAELKIDDEIIEFAKASSDRRSEESYVIRYKDEINLYNFYNDEPLLTVIKKGKPETMRLIEALLRLNYYILVHQKMPWDELKDIVCPETCIKDVSGQTIKAAILRVDDDPEYSNEKVTITSWDDLKRIKLSRNQIKISISFRSITDKFRWNERSIQVLV